MYFIFLLLFLLAYFFLIFNMRRWQRAKLCGQNDKYNKRIFFHPYPRSASTMLTTKNHLREGCHVLYALSYSLGSFMNDIRHKNGFFEVILYFCCQVFKNNFFHALLCIFRSFFLTFLDVICR